MRPPILVVAVLTLCAAIAAGLLYRNARADPVVRRAAVTLPDWPAGAAPVRIALVSDIHAGNLVTDAARVARMVAIVNAQHPDLVLLAGDFVAGRTRADAQRGVARIGALGGFDAPLGTIAVLGNHDHEADATLVRQALRARGVTLLDNDAAVAGPLVVGGLDDELTGFANRGRMLAAMARRRGARIVLAHSPDIAAGTPDIASGLVLSGHTHCGQVVLPLIGVVIHGSHYGQRYNCGAVRERARTTVISAGVGTSDLPFRWNAPPDIWVVDVRGAGAAQH